MNLLQDKVCIVTGAGKGFGRDIAREYYTQGAKIALITRSQSDVDSLIAEFNNIERVLVVCGDVSKRNVFDLFVQKTEQQFGLIDVLVNNAGMRFRKAFLEISEKELNQVLNVNFKSVFNMCQEVLPSMIKNNSGKIINMSSIAGTLGFADLSAYVTSKAAIIGLTKSLAIEFASNNIQINAIAPGFCKTSYFENFKNNDTLYKMTLDKTPLKRWGESGELIGLCRLLLSSDGAYINGASIPVDGGWLA